MNVIWFLMGLWLGFGLRLVMAISVIKISKAYHNLFMDWVKEIRKNKKYKNIKS